MLATVLLGLSLWTTTSIAAAILLGWVLHDARTHTRHGDVVGQRRLSGAR